MRKRMLVTAIVLVALAALANVGLRLAAALHQVDALARVGADGVMRAKGAPPAPLASPAPHAAPPAERGTETREPPTEGDVRFDAEGALREAGDRDPNIAELLNDPDPAVGGAVRDFITHLDPPGWN